MTHAASLPKSIGARIVWARKRRGISQERLAEMIGTSRRHMIRLEKDQHAPGEGLRERLSEALGEKAEFFAGDEDDEEADSLSLDEILRRRVDSLVAERIEELTRP